MSASYYGAIFPPYPHDMARESARPAQFPDCPACLHEARQATTLRDLREQAASRIVARTHVTLCPRHAALAVQYKAARTDAQEGSA